MQIRILTGTATIGLMVSLTACIPIPIATRANDVEVVQEPRPIDDRATWLSGARLAPLDNTRMVAVLAKALSKAAPRMKAVEGSLVWRTAFPDFNLDEIPVEEFMADERRARLLAMGLRFVLVLGSVRTNSSESDEFPLPYLMKWDVDTTLWLTVVDLARDGSRQQLTVRTSGQGGAFYLPAYILVFTRFETYPDTEKAAAEAGAARVAALVTGVVPEGDVGIVIVSQAR